MKPARLLLVLVIMVFASSTVIGQVESTEDVEIDFTFNQKIPMRDGVHLASYIWKPAAMDKPLPVIFSLTPYTIEMAYKEGPFMAENGYVFVLVDVRGRANSEGEFWPWEKDGRDGYDVVEWIAKQPWCDGQVGMIGGSYRGTTQWLTLKKASVGPKP